LEAVIYDKVAEIFCYYAIKGLRDYFKSINLYKNNVSNVSSIDGWKSVSYSTHHSILMNRKVCNLEKWNKLEETLAPFMVCRILLTGAGDYVPCLKEGRFPRPGKVMKGHTLKYAISPRAMFIKRISSNDTVEARGLFNQRDDPHADPNKYWRFHDINFEGLRSPFQVYLRDCLEVMVMTAYEDGFYKNPPKLAEPIKAIKELTLDTENCEWKVELKNGKKVDALTDIMEGFYIAGIEEMLSQRNTTLEDKMAFNIIHETIQLLGERRLEYFIDGIDWITKKALIEEFAQGNLDEASGICNQFSLIDETVLKYINGGLENSNITTFNLEKAIEFTKDAIPIIDWNNLPKKIKFALRNGPQGTREYIRCLVAKEFPGLVEQIEWERIKFHNATIRLQEPFKFNKYTSGEILEKSTRTLSDFTLALDKLNQMGDHIIWNPSDDHERRQ
jgi:hypothetical protein